MDDKLPVSVDGEHAIAGVLTKLLILTIVCLLVCGGSDKVELFCEVHATRNDRSGLVVKIEQFDHSLVDLLLDAGEVVLKPTDKQVRSL
jgi:hypothetical protein